MNKHQQETSVSVPLLPMSRLFLIPEEIQELAGALSVIIEMESLLQT